MAEILKVVTPGYWPLPNFSKINFGKKWQELSPLELKEKEHTYSVQAAIPKIMILEASITKALPKKIIVFAGKRRFALSRWIGGIYSNIDPRSLSQLRMFYDSIAQSYCFHVEPERKNQLAAFIEYLPKNAPILDASAGDCSLAFVAGKNFDFTCADISEGMLSLRDKKQIPTHKTAVASASKLPFAAHSFGAVVHTFSNIHSLDRRKFFSEFHRVLKSGGLLLYHPVKSPGEQWPKNFVERTVSALRAAGFADVRRISTEAKGKKKTTLVFYLAK